MNDYLINSAALYFGFGAPQSVPILWLTRAVDLFSSQNIALDEFQLIRVGVSSSDEVCSFPADKDDLFRTVNQGLVRSIGLYFNPDASLSKSFWQAMISIDMKYGELFVGIDEARFSQHDQLLRSAYYLGGELLGVKYGISYKQLRSKGPESYASGVMQGSLADIKNFLASRQFGRSPLAAWREEQSGSRNYLSGLFRGTYPASIISTEHLAALRGCSPSGQIPGKITPLVENKVWIWELSSSEMVVAEKLLREGSLLIE